MSSRSTRQVIRSCLCNWGVTGIRPSVMHWVHLSCIGCARHSIHAWVMSHAVPISHTRSDQTHGQSAPAHHQPPPQPTKPVSQLTDRRGYTAFRDAMGTRGRPLKHPSRRCRCRGCSPRTAAACSTACSPLLPAPHHSPSPAAPCRLPQPVSPLRRLHRLLHSRVGWLLQM